MYYQSYEDYMRNILGYPVLEDRQANTYEAYQNNYYHSPMNVERTCQNDEHEIEMLYPEIYRMIHPLVCQSCLNCRTPMTKEVLESMTEEIYQKVISNQEIMVQINVENRSNSESTNRKELENRMIVEKSNGNLNRNTNANNSSVAKNNLSKQAENRNIEETRQRRPNNNSLLRDLIRILILRQILGENRPPHRPPFPGPGMPPPHGGPGRPPFPGGRPPRPEPREYEVYL